MEVIVVGGGVIGWSVAHHLVRQDSKTKVTVLERHATYGLGATGKAAGGVRAQFGSEPNIRMSLESISFFEQFEQHTGTDPGFHQNGYLFVAATERAAEALEMSVALQNSCGVPSKILTNYEVREIAPYLYSDDIINGSFSATDGFLDPYSVCKGFERAARNSGVQAKYGSQAQTITAREVVTQEGAWKADAVCVCAGHYTAELLASSGIDVPIKPEKHQLAMTERIDMLPADLPMVVDFDTSFHFRREGAGLLIGYDDEALRSEQQVEEPVFDTSFIDRLAEPALHRLPLLAETSFDTKKGWAGYYAETPDGHAILGETNDVFVAAGFGGHGVMHSPAAGAAMAELILNERLQSDWLVALAPQRFERGELLQEFMTI